MIRETIHKHTIFFLYLIVFVIILIGNTFSFGLKHTPLLLLFFLPYLTIYGVFYRFNFNYKNKDEVFKLIVTGNVNILNNKINFKNIKVNQGYEAAKEDLSYFKQSFENILFDEDFLSIFNLKKIKKFIFEIS